VSASRAFFLCEMTPYNGPSSFPKVFFRILRMNLAGLVKIGFLADRDV